MCVYHLVNWPTAVYVASRWNFPLWTSSSTLKLFFQQFPTWKVVCRQSLPLPATQTAENRWRKPDKVTQVSVNCLLVWQCSESFWLVFLFCAVFKGVKHGGVFSFKLFAVLGSFHVEVCDDHSSIADIRVQGTSHCSTHVGGADRDAKMNVNAITWLLLPCRDRCICVGTGKGDRGVCSAQKHHGHRCQPQHHPQKGWNNNTSDCYWCAVINRCLLIFNITVDHSATVPDFSCY